MTRTGVWTGVVCAALVAGGCGDDGSGRAGVGSSEDATSGEPARPGGDDRGQAPPQGQPGGGPGGPTDPAQPPGTQPPGGGGEGALQPGVGPDTARDCGPGGAALPPVSSPGAPVEAICFFGDDPSAPAALIEQVIETVDNEQYVHVRLTLSPDFVDNTYGENAIGWEDSKKGTHTFKDLVGSDHAELKLTDARGETVMHFKVDYLSEDPSAPSGYGTLGVLGGKNDGEMIVGDAAHVLGVATSLDRNFNGCGYAGYTEDSPQTDGAFTPDPGAPRWDYRMVYEVWIDMAAFGDAGFGQAFIEHVHASPSKGADNTVIVQEGPCPPTECFNLDSACESGSPPPGDDDPGDGDPGDGGEPQADPPSDPRPPI